MEAPWTQEISACEKALDTNLDKGLTDKKVEKKLEEFGYNELEKEEGRSFWELVLEQFEDPLVKILLFAAVISAVIAVNEAYDVGHALTVDKFVEPLVILLILILNAIVGVYQESNAEKSLEALKDMQPDLARTLRNGAWVSELSARLLVPGDVVELRVGDKVPADCRVAQLKTTTLRVEQMALTGESVAVSKQDEPISRVDCEIQSKANMLFAGTTLSNGHCICIVTGTALNTEIGKIQEQIQAAAAARAEEKTPLKEKLEQFSDMLQWIISAICLLVWLINFRMFVDLETMSFDYKKCIYYFQIAVALAVAAIPEGLPAVITMCLALGTRKMAARNAIVRKLPAVETLGCTSVICSDKTGTLTTNQMSVCEVVTFGNKQEQLVETFVSGSTYNPNEGQAELDGRVSPSIEKLAQICSLCNESTVEMVPGTDKFKHIGAPTEAALTVVVEKLLGHDSKDLSDLPNNTRLHDESENVATLEFTRDRKSMSVLVSTGKTRTKSNQLLVKGAPESLLDRCSHIMLEDGRRVPLTEAGRKASLGAIEKMAKRAWRCLGVAYSQDLGALSDYDGPHHAAAAQLRNPENFAKVETNLTFVGVVGMQDPPRAEVRASMNACQQAGIRVIVITGDNKLTAEAICRDIGVFEADEDISEKSFIGHDFSKLPVERQREILLANRLTGMVFSRAEPKFKQDIVTLLKSAGDVVAMTGDGVNDAPALKMADIGIAMGITGTEVAKEASDMVLADDNFRTIVDAVEEGRSIYNNMRAFIRYMISSNIGEVMSIFFTAALGMPEGMVPIQLLWVNLVTDGPPATALSFNPADPDIMEKPPRDRNEPLISNWVMFRYMVVGLYVGFATVGSFATWFTHGVGSEPFLGFIDLAKDGHTSVTFSQLINWNSCNVTDNMFEMDGESKLFKASSWVAGGIEYDVTGCDYFGEVGKVKASTISLSVLVTIEMFNALNAVSEDGSLVRIPPWVNPYLIMAMLVSFALHFVILYVPALCPMFDVVPLNFEEWLLVLVYSFPVILIDEVLKFIGRRVYGRERDRREAALLATKKRQ
mmetsp:Transcript_17711/g.38770  ORF Transcript_17711/g.38770 Transcript_17711/m.38770 type:complete len:1054 (-) Transcript_17711:706-3867(-)|eukprot:CAMPEP_0203753666 /NCGR_PEP_ID=MMETSP0098-20131031/7386_1 /ASSEMBLY_ACC=CAM_ASM_000208 /TAXON_ID=96639 /ORGANISM=" , Strain NY0313808BC1" /LENGTH=1053 /DNA_ID=CAMNT_0050644343 /DNA_START=177 /DNA_END=3338 /DNA_ORIENTATION=-